jgi:hypothetical protein
MQEKGGLRQSRRRRRRDYIFGGGGGGDAPCAAARDLWLCRSPAAAVGRSRCSPPPPNDAIALQQQDCQTSGFAGNESLSPSPSPARTHARAWNPEPGSGILGPQSSRKMCTLEQPSKKLCTLQEKECKCYWHQIYVHTLCSIVHRGICLCTAVLWSRVVPNIDSDSASACLSSCHG